jgi:hypothetical protein
VTELVEVGRFETLAEGQQRALVLAAVGIDCRLVTSDRIVELGLARSDRLWAAAAAVPPRAVQN